MAGLRQPELLGLTTGISVGWADKYSYNLNRQWIKINGLPDGVYHVRVDTYPYNWFDETTRVDNTTWAKIGICGTTVTTAPQSTPAGRPSPCQADESPPCPRSQRAAHHSNTLAYSGETSSAGAGGNP